jgi:hypothetical protein
VCGVCEGVCIDVGGWCGCAWECVGGCVGVCVYM